LPRVTGVELLKKVHATRMAVPVVLATGTLPVQEFARYPWLEPAAVLLKPYSFDELLETVEKVLRATVIASAEIEPPQSKHGEPPNEGLRL